MSAHLVLTPRRNQILQNVRLTGYRTPYVPVHTHGEGWSDDVYTSCARLREVMGQQVFVVRYRYNKEERRWDCSR